MTSNCALPWKPRTIGLRDLRFSVMAVWSCGSFCRLASSSSTNHTGCCSGVGALSRRRTSMSIQRLCSGRSASRSAGCEVMKIHPWRFFDQSRAVHSVLASVFFGSRRKLSAIRLNEPSTPERWCGADGSISEASSVFFTRWSISSGCDIHCTNCCGEGSSRSKWANIFCGLSVKNSPFLSLVGWKSDAATVRASARRTNSSDGPQYGHRRSSGLRTMSPLGTKDRSGHHGRDEKSGTGEGSHGAGESHDDDGLSASGNGTEQSRHRSAESAEVRDVATAKKTA